jgi:hypothetical protein
MPPLPAAAWTADAHQPPVELEGGCEEAHCPPVCRGGGVPEQPLRHWPARHGL